MPYKLNDLAYITFVTPDKISEMANIMFGMAVKIFATADVMNDAPDIIFGVAYSALESLKMAKNSFFDRFRIENVVK